MFCCLGFFTYYLTIGPIQRVVNLYLNDVTTRLAQRDIKLNVDDIECTWLVQKGFSDIYGAHRPGIAPYKKGGHLRDPPGTERLRLRLRDYLCPFSLVCTYFGIRAVGFAVFEMMKHHVLESYENAQGVRAGEVMV